MQDVRSLGKARQALGTAFVLTVLTGVCGFFVLLIAVSCSSTLTSGNCRTVANCKDDDKPICDAETLSCRPCRPGTDDIACRNRNSGTPLCGSNGHCSVACTSSAECTRSNPRTQTPICERNTCRRCLVSADCESGVCSADGSCVPTSDVLFVNNKGPDCMNGGPQDGTELHPFCKLSEGITNALDKARSAILISPSADPYEGIELTSAPSQGLLLRGIGSQRSDVKILSTTVQRPGLRIMLNSGQRIEVQNLQIQAPFGKAVDCTGTGKLTLSNIQIDSSATGIAASECTLVLDRARIYANTVIGVSLDNVTYTVDNLMLWSNEIGMKLTGGMGTVRFATIYGNGRGTSPSTPGVTCTGGPMVTLENSIIYNNVSASKNSGQTAGCLLSNVVTDDSEATGPGVKMLTMTSPIDFVVGVGAVPDLDLRLKSDSANTRNTSIDKLTPTTGMTFIDHDIDGGPRPVNGSADIGAHEVQ